MMEAEQLLGRKVVDAGGLDVGVVLDVGIGEQRAPKFLLVGTAAARYRRVEMRDVAEVGPETVLLRPA